jgi:hypothetical protein
MTNMTSSAMWNNGIIAIRILFNTTWRPEKENIQTKMLNYVIIRITLNMCRGTFVIL